jgi:hypothetical protein
MAQWEELVGDSSEMRESSDAQTRRTMATLLKHPTQFGLPPWPRPTERITLGVQETLPPVEPEPPNESAAIYQLDMLTGELVPQQRLPKPQPAEAVKRRANRPRPLKRRLPDHVAQLVLFPDEDLAS